MTNLTPSKKPQGIPVRLVIAAIVVVVIGVVVFFVLNQQKKIDNSANATNQATAEIQKRPAGCPESTSVVVKSPEAGTQKISTANSNFIQSANDQGSLIFTNYTLNPENVYADITADKVLTVIKLTKLDKTNIDAGIYRKTSGTSKTKPNFYSPEYNISTAGLAGAVFDDNSMVTVTYIGADYVCGSVTSEDSKSSINGDFMAKFLKKGE